ncbi:MAG: hypothetical protein ACLFTH_03520 [Candidatus Woesearchaeota archaeon]
MTLEGIAQEPALKKLYDTFTKEQGVVSVGERGVVPGFSQASLRYFQNYNFISIEMSELSVPVERAMFYYDTVEEVGFMITAPLDQHFYRKKYLSLVRPGHVSGELQQTVKGLVGKKKILPPMFSCMLDGYYVYEGMIDLIKQHHIYLWYLK